MLINKVFDTELDEIAPKGEMERLRAALAAISQRPAQMNWGEYYEVEAAMRDMEKIADDALTNTSNKGDGHEG